MNNNQVHPAPQNPAYPPGPAGVPQAPTDDWQRPPPPPKNDDGESGPSDDEDDGPEEEHDNAAIYEDFGEAGPPPPVEVQQEMDAPHMEFAHASNISEAECRDAVLEYVAEHCCYGKGCAEKHVVNQILPSSALHYILETYTEARRTERAFEPYPGGWVDGPENGRPPRPWDMECHADQLFVDEVKTLEVPHTSYIKLCQRCEGCGQVRCKRCGGRGTNRCGSCFGRGHQTRHNQEGSYTVCCHSCGGDGRCRCQRCGGDGRVRCPRCSGCGRLRWFIELIVTFTNNKADHIIEKTDMPDNLIRKVSGITVFEQTNLMVPPISFYPEKEIADNSVRLVEYHRHAFPNQRYLQQRQVLLSVPVTEVHFTWKDVEDRYWVYGTDRKVYFPTYPQTCCWGCQIL